MTLCALDSQQIETVPVSTSLYSCLPRQHSTPPAAITCASLTTKTRDRYQVPGRLMLVSVSNNSLKLVETIWKISATFSNKNLTPCPLSFPLLSTQETKAATVLSIQLPSVRWSSSLLSQVRDLVLQAALQVIFHPGSIVSKPDKVDTLEDILTNLDILSIESYPQAVTAAPKLSILQSFTEDSHEITQTVTAGEETTVTVHSGLPGVKVVAGTACQYTVVAVTGTIATIKCGEKPVMSLPGVPLAHSAAAGDLCLYSGDGSTNHRAVVTDISE